VALGLLGGVVLGILGKVAFVASLSDGGRSRGTLDGDELMELVLEFLKAFFAIILYFCHCNMLFL
jgi:hypothetical protein